LEDLFESLSGVDLDNLVKVVVVGLSQRRGVITSGTWRERDLEVAQVADWDPDRVNVHSV
jgi:hypothetical protein